MRHRLVFAMGIAAIALSSIAHAGDGVDDPSALLRRGLELRREHKNQDALVTFRAAVAISPTPLAKAQVALAEHALRRWVDAERDLDEVLAIQDDPWIQKHREALEGARASVAEHLAWIRVDVNAPSAEAQIDGRVIATGTEVRVVAQQSILEVRAVAYAPVIRRVDLAPGLHTSLAIMLDPMPPTVAPALRAPPSTSPSHSAIAPTTTMRAAEAPADAPRRAGAAVGPIALGVVGAAGLGIGSYYGIRAIGLKHDRDALCPGGPPCTRETLTIDADARASATAATIAFGAGLVSVAAGITWWALRARPARPSQAARLDIAPGLGGIVVGGEL